MFETMWIKRRVTKRTAIIAFPVLNDCHLIFTRAAENRLCMKINFIPDHGRMPRLLLMAVIAGIVFVTTFEFYGNDV